MTLYHLGYFQSAREYATRGVQIWRSEGGSFPVEDVETSAICCLVYQAVVELVFGEIVSSKETLLEAIALAKELMIRTD
jgi:hypothetical protein